MNKDYFKIKDIDQGAFGKVIMSKNKNSNEIVAIKILNKKYKNWDECLNLREVKSLLKLNKLKHPNIIKLKEVLKVENELSWVFEYADRNLFKLYTEQYRDLGKEMPEATIKTIIYQIASALSSMHKNGFFHRDIKPENILINSNNVVKLADFGLAREIRSVFPYTDYVGTRWYRSPDILLDSTNYNSPCDIFALGCIMAELYIWKPLFNGINSLDQLNKIFQVLGTPSKDWVEGYKLANKKRINFQKYNPINLSELIPNASKEGMDLIKKMLEYDSQKRIKASQIINHPYFTKSMVSQGNYNDFNLIKNKINLNTLNNKPKNKIEFENKNFNTKSLVKKETDNWDDFNIEFTNNKTNNDYKNSNNINNNHNKNVKNDYFNDKDWDNGEDEWQNTKPYLKENKNKNNQLYDNKFSSSINTNNKMTSNKINNISNSYFIRSPMVRNNKSNREKEKNLFDDPFLDEKLNNYQNNSVFNGLNIFKKK